MMFIRLFFLCLVFHSICGDNIAVRLMNRYNDLVNHCLDKKNNKHAAYKCAGLMIRGLANIGGAQQLYAWSKKVSNKRCNAFSVGYLRKDQPFSRFPHGYDSGFIYYPHFNTPKNKNQYTVFCAFPVDAWTDYREGRHGCGKKTNDKSGRSGHCDTQGITTMAKWTKHFEEVTKNRDKKFVFGKYQCGFDLTTKDAARDFSLVLESKKWLRRKNRKYEWYHNELRIKAWDENHPEKLPIEAFFYVINNNPKDKDAKIHTGRPKAFKYQSDYLRLTGELIPVVGIRLPTAGDLNLVVIHDKKE